MYYHIVLCRIGIRATLGPLHDQGGEREIRPPILYYHMLCYTILYCIILYYTITYSSLLYYTVLYYTILYYTILYYNIL